MGRPYIHERDKLFGSAPLATQVSFSVADEDTEAIAVTISIKDNQGFAIEGNMLGKIWISDAIYGAATDGPSSSLSMAATSGCTQLEAASATQEISDFVLTATSVITVTDASGTSDTAYVNIALPCGSIYAQAITFAA